MAQPAKEWMSLQPTDRAFPSCEPPFPIRRAIGLYVSPNLRGRPVGCDLGAIRFLRTGSSQHPGVMAEGRGSDVADLGRQTEIVRCAVAGWQPDREYWINMWAEPDGAITAFSSHQKYRVMPDAKAVVIPHSGLWPDLIYSVEPDERIGRGGFWLLGESGAGLCVPKRKLSFSQTPNLD